MYVYWKLTHDSYRDDLKMLIDLLRVVGERTIIQNINDGSDTPISDNNNRKIVISLENVPELLDDIMLVLVTNDVFIAFDNDEKMDMAIPKDELLLRASVYKTDIIIYCTIRKN